MKRLVAIGSAIALSLSSALPARSNPAFLAPVALCAGTAGMGCALIGTVLVGGTIYYIWQLSNGHKVRTDAHGRVFRSEYLQNPEEETNVSGRNGDSGYWDEPIYASSYKSAKERCKALARKYKVGFVDIVPDERANQFRCKFKGGQS